MLFIKEVSLPVFCASVVLIFMVNTVNCEESIKVSSNLKEINHDLTQESVKLSSIKSAKAINKIGSSSEESNDLSEEVKSIGGKRHPKLGFNIPLPSIPGLTPSTMTTIRPPVSDFSGVSGSQGQEYYDSGNNIGGASGLGLASTAFLVRDRQVKSGVLTGLTALKAAVIPPLFIGSIIVFLIAGAVFFTCSVINCGIGSNSPGSGVGGGFGPGFGGLPSFPNLFNRNGYDYYEQQVQPVYQALDEGFKKFE